MLNVIKSGDEWFLTGDKEGEDARYFNSSNLSIPSKVYDDLIQIFLEHPLESFNEFRLTEDSDEVRTLTHELTAELFESLNADKRGNTFWAAVLDWRIANGDVKIDKKAFAAMRNQIWFKLDDYPNLSNFIIQEKMKNSKEITLKLKDYLIDFDIRKCFLMNDNVARPAFKKLLLQYLPFLFIDDSLKYGWSLTPTFSVGGFTTHELALNVQNDLTGQVLDLVKLAEDKGIPVQHEVDVTKYPTPEGWIMLNDNLAVDQIDPDLFIVRKW